MSEKEKMRDHVSLIQESFQQLLMGMIDILGCIQRDAHLDLEKLPCTDGILKYDDIPVQAKRIVTIALSIDALIDEAMETTCFMMNHDDVINSLKEESRAYENGINELRERDERAKLWRDRIHGMLDLITKSYGHNPEEEDEEESEEDL